MILAAASVSTDGSYVATAGHTMAVYVGLLVVHGLLNSVGTRIIAAITRVFVFINLGTVLAVVIALAVTCKDKHPVRVTIPPVCLPPEAAPHAHTSNRTGFLRFHRGNRPVGMELDRLLGPPRLPQRVLDHDGLRRDRSH